MTVPLMALAVGAIVAGFVSIPPALGGGAVLEHFLAPSFTAAGSSGARGSQAASRQRRRQQPKPRTKSRTFPRGAELGLMAFSVMIALIGIVTAYRFYVLSPETADRLKERYAGAHNLLYNKYFVDELYDATFIKGTMKSSFGLWAFDRRVVDGAVNGTGWAHRIRVVDLEPHRSLRRRRRGQSRRPVVRRIELRIPPGPDRTGSELRAADAGRRMRVCEHLLAREVIP